jgi:hypothetical protein
MLVEALMTTLSNSVALGAVMLGAILGSATVAAAAPVSCDEQLTVELTPDVPDPRDDGFLSSLLGSHTGYQLTLRQQPNSSVVVLELTGPGPSYRCDKVVDAMRKDGRVLSVQVHDSARASA